LVISPIGPLAGGIDAVAVGLRRKGIETPLGRFGLGGADFADLPLPTGKPAVLHLSVADVLSKTITLPLAAERRLEKVLTFELDRETPFRPDEIFWNYSVVERDRSRGQLVVRLLLVPRSRLAPLLGVLSIAGILPKRAEIGTEPGPRSELILNTDGKRLRDATTARLLRWAAVSLSICLTIAAAAMPFARQSFAIAELDRKTTIDRAAATEAEKLRHEIELLSGTADLIESERDKAGQPLVAIAELTRMLPDDTYLTQLQLLQRKVTISGRSASASRLIGSLAAGDQLRNPAFAAPVTRIGTSEAFTISVEIGP